MENGYMIIFKSEGDSENRGLDLCENIHQAPVPLPVTFVKIFLVFRPVTIEIGLSIRRQSWGWRNNNSSMAGCVTEFGYGWSTRSVR
jgi:hypothetical protein